jgi:hypothetical protein
VIECRKADTDHGQLGVATRRSRTVPSANGSDRPEPELHHIRMHAVKPPFTERGRLPVVKLTDKPS